MKKINLLDRPQITSFDHPHSPYLLTIIIPLYQRTLYLPYLFQSIENSFQESNPSIITNRPIQCLIMDDNGSDPSIEWIITKLATNWKTTTKSLIHLFYHRFYVFSWELLLF